MLQPQTPGPVPADTARVARAAFPKGSPLIALRDELGAVFRDDDFAGLYPPLGQPAYPPWRLALVTVLQFREGLSDRAAADAVRARIDWKYLLGLPLGDPGFDFSVLCEFRSRLVEHGAEHVLLDKVVEACRERGLLKTRGRQRTDSTHVAAAVRELNRLELAAETVRAALNELAGAAPDWLRRLARPEWTDRYGRRVEDSLLPQSKAGRARHAVAVGTDGYALLDAVEAADAPPGLARLPVVGALRRIWGRHYERDADGVRPRELRGRGPEKGDSVESPYDTDARYRRKRGTAWMGYTVHLTETCDADRPRLVVHADTTAGDVHEAARADPILAAIEERGLSAEEHLADAAYISADLLVGAADRYGVRLVGPPRKDASWQGRTDGAYTATDFALDYDRGVATCPEGEESKSWRTYTDRDGGGYVMARFAVATCRACSARDLCVRSETSGRSLRLHPERDQAALEGMRAELATDEGWAAYSARAGVEGTLSQGVRAMGLRRTRYRGLAKTRLGHVATAAAITTDRAAAWVRGERPGGTRASRFARLVA